MVNGVSRLHGEILKDDMLNDIYTIRPERFTHVTNGIDHRRWMAQINPELHKFICESLGSDEYLTKPETLIDLAKFADDSAATEDVIFYDGKAHKLDEITFNIPDTSYTDQWAFTSSDGRFEMTFDPIIDRAAKIDVKFIVTDQHQVFGRMNGRCILDDGTELEVKDLLCFAEDVHNRY